MIKKTHSKQTKIINNKNLQQIYYTIRFQKVSTENKIYEIFQNNLQNQLYPNKYNYKILK